MADIIIGGLDQIPGSELYQGAGNYFPVGGSYVNKAVADENVNFEDVKEIPESDMDARYKVERTYKTYRDSYDALRKELIGYLKKKENIQKVLEEHKSMPDDAFGRDNYLKQLMELDTKIKQINSNVSNYSRTKIDINGKALGYFLIPDEEFMNIKADSPIKYTRDREINKIQKQYKEKNSIFNLFGNNNYKEVKKRKIGTERIDGRWIDIEPLKLEKLNVSDFYRLTFKDSSQNNKTIYLMKTPGDKFYITPFENAEVLNKAKIKFNEVDLNEEFKNIFILPTYKKVKLNQFLFNFKKSDEFNRNNLIKKNVDFSDRIYNENDKANDDDPKIDDNIDTDNLEINSSDIDDLVDKTNKEVDKKLENISNSVGEDSSKNDVPNINKKVEGNNTSSKIDNELLSSKEERMSKPINFIVGENPKTNTNEIKNEEVKTVVIPEVKLVNNNQKTPIKNYIPETEIKITPDGVTKIVPINNSNVKEDSKIEEVKAQNKTLINSNVQSEIDNEVMKAETEQVSLSNSIQLSMKKIFDDLSSKYGKEFVKKNFDVALKAALNEMDVIRQNELNTMINSMGNENIDNNKGNILQ